MVSGSVWPFRADKHTYARRHDTFPRSCRRPSLMDWLQGHIFPAEKKLNEEWVYWGTMLACAEMILSGTTAFCDMYLFEHKVAEAAKRAGIRALVGEVLYDFPSPAYGEVDNGLRHTELLIERWREDPLVTVAVEPHALYTCSPDLLTTVASSAHGGVPA